VRSDRATKKRMLHYCLAASRTVMVSPVMSLNNIYYYQTYLGVHLQSDRFVKFNISHTKRNFYAACNTIFLHCHGVNDIALLQLPNRC